MTESHCPTIMISSQHPEQQNAMTDSCKKLMPSKADPKSVKAQAYVHKDSVNVYRQQISLKHDNLQTRIVEEQEDNLALDERPRTASNMSQRFKQMFTKKDDADGLWSQEHFTLTPVRYKARVRLFLSYTFTLTFLPLPFTLTRITVKSLCGCDTHSVIRFTSVPPIMKLWDYVSNAFEQHK